MTGRRTAPEPVAATDASEKAPRPSGPAAILRSLGPGLITGAADDDPSGIATYSQVGAQFGYGMAWTMLFSFPLLAAVQEISARIGSSTGHGIATNLRRHYPAWLLRWMLTLLLIANILNLGADIGAMADALRLLIGGPAAPYTLLFGVICVGLEIFISYSRYASFLKWLTLSLLAYVACAFAVGLPWGEALSSTVLPSIHLDADHATALVAILGTTISPYLFFWQSAQEVEEGLRRHVKPLCITPRKAGPELRRIRFDTLVGMGASHLIALFIILTAGATLHVNGITDIATSSQAAEALRPIAGPFTFALFAAGIIGTGMLAVPILAGSAAYALGEAMRWPIGLDRRWHEAKAFYGTIAVATLAGAAISLSPFDPVRALFWAAVVNGVLAVPLMVVLMLIATNGRILGRLTLPPMLRLIGWLATAVMGAAAVAMIALAA